MDSLSEFFTGPRFLFGEPRREWSFLFLMTSSVVGSGLISGIVASVALLYISGMAEKVTLPASKFTMDSVQFSTLKAPFPKGFELVPLQVQYLEDEQGLVYAFHQAWQEGIRGYSKGELGGGVVFEELGKVCASAAYAPGRRITSNGLSLDIPITGADVWPAIFPVEVVRDPANRGGNNISKVNVTYARVPVWSLASDIYEWRDKSSPKTVSGKWGKGRFSL
jgi:hypothetical protein